jgi:acyl transferase domain-containing protein
MRHPKEKIADEVYLLKQLGQLWSSGVKIKWENFYLNEKRRRVPLPTYPFERKRYWIDGNPFAMFLKATGGSSSRVEKNADLNEWIFLPSWERSEHFNTQKTREISKVLVFANDNFLSLRLVEEFTKEFQQIILVKQGSEFNKMEDNIYLINPENSDDYELLIDKLASENSLPELIIHFWNITDTFEFNFSKKNIFNMLKIGFYSLLFLTKALNNIKFRENLDVVVLSNGIYKILGHEKINPIKATLLGPCKIAPHEYKNISFRNIDIVLPSENEKGKEELINKIFKEIVYCFEPVVAFRNNFRWTQTFKGLPIETKEELVSKKDTDFPELLKTGGVYLITGGLGKMGLLYTKYLLQKYNAKIILVSYSDFPQREEWDEWCKTHGDDNKTSQRIKKLNELEEYKDNILIYKTDLSNPEKLKDIILKAEEKLGKLNGIIHAAGVTEFNFISELTKSKCEEHFRAKVYGVLGIYKVLSKMDLDFCLLMSSLSTILGGVGLTAYAASNVFMDAFVQDIENVKQCKWISIDWCMWDFDESKSKLVPKKGKVSDMSMHSSEGLEILRKILFLHKSNQFIVSTGSMDLLLNNWIDFSKNKFKHVEDSYKENILESNVDYIPPGNDLEKQVVEIWQEVLRINRIGINDNFFDIGGTSITLIYVNNLVKQQLDIKSVEEIELTTYFEYPTIASFVKYIQKKNEDDESNIQNLKKAKNALNATINRRKGIKNDGK